MAPGPAPGAFAELFPQPAKNELSARTSVQIAIRCSVPKALLRLRDSACRFIPVRSEEHTSELQSLTNLVCRLLLEKKKKQNDTPARHENSDTAKQPAETRAVG